MTFTHSSVPVLGSLWRGKVTAQPCTGPQELGLTPGQLGYKTGAFEVLKMGVLGNPSHAHLNC